LAASTRKGDLALPFGVLEDTGVVVLGSDLAPLVGRLYPEGHELAAPAFILL